MLKDLEELPLSEQCVDLSVKKQKPKCSPIIPAFWAISPAIDSLKIRMITDNIWYFRNCWVEGEMGYSYHHLSKRCKRFFGFVWKVGAFNAVVLNPNWLVRFESYLGANE